MKNILFTLFFTTICFALLAQKVAIVGVNEASPDGFSFVALEDLPANTRIYFTTEEYDDGNSRFCDNLGPGCLTEEAGYWESTALIPRGTVISITETSADNLVVACSGSCDGQPLNISDCGTATLIAPFFSFGGQDEIYLYADTDNDPTNGVSDIYSVAYWNHGSTSNGGSIILPSGDDPIGEFPDVIRLDGFSNVAASDHFEFTVGLRGGTVDQPALEDPANYTVGTNTGGLPLDLTCFSDVSGTGPCDDFGGDTDSDGVCDDNDGCPTDPLKTAPGVCGCNVVEADANGNGITDCLEAPKAAIVGVNENEPDAFSFVALEELPIGTRIYFTSDEYNAGTGAFAPGGEEVGYFEATSAIAAGTVIVIKETGINVLSVDCCGTVTLVSGSFTFGSQDELYLYLDSDTDPTNGITNIYSVSYHNHNTPEDETLPAANDPSGEFPNVYILDGLPDIGTAGQFEYTISERDCGLPTKAQLEDPANYTLNSSTPSPDLSSVDFAPDPQAPTITCPMAISVECESDLPPFDPNDASATDNCTASPTLGGSRGALTGGACGGTITETYTATDNSGNQTSCYRVITVDDNTAPVISCPANTTADCEATTPASTGTATATDNCGGSPSVTSSDAFNAGVITRTWTATDACGNTASCVQTITVTDTEDPVAVCQDVTIQLDANGSAILTAAEVDGGSSDNCGPLTLSIDKSSFDCGDVSATGGSTVVNSTNGYSVVVQLTPTVVNAPASCPWGYNYTVNIAYAVSFTGTPPSSLYTLQGFLSCDPANSYFPILYDNEFVNNGTNRTGTSVTSNAWNGMTNCVGITPEALGCDQISLQVQGPGISYRVINIPINYGSTQTVTLTVTDGYGNSDQCTATVTVEDNNSACQSLLGQGGGFLSEESSSSTEAPLPSPAPKGSLWERGETGLTLAVYPNPTSGLVTVELPAALPLEGVSLEVIDIYGRILMENSRLDHRQPLDLSKFNPGTYLLRLRTPDGEQFVERVVVQR